MPERVLITGGAGFIGRHVAELLLEHGYKVRALDSLIEQVHPPGRHQNELPADVELVVGDIRDESAVQRALEGAESVIHLAAEVGVGQSMYAVERYTSVNDVGTAVLFQCLIERPVRRVVTASSMSIYGEGLYRSADGALHQDVVRDGRNKFGGWDPLGPDEQPLSPAPTPETKSPGLRSVYAINKYVQERLTLTLARQYGMECAALRLWNAYGPGQALSNPYTGVLAIFASRVANGERPMVFEDGQQRRDFVHVADVAAAFLLALRHPSANGEVFNIGSGEDRTVEEVARVLASTMGRTDLEPLITDQARAGDIRHNIPDLTKARTMLGYRPRRDFSEGLHELAEWVARQEADDRVAEARRELEMRGLVA
ncbi:MAG TPA: SDR family NAD(P)-dependent oxidoreductase [Vitreimonas sp.]|uniref:NAD-dependent epimerase/dehydratase family protein n=1 Tax=Vitreimonas sp. TaxID=3069702 RepID=UPI002D6E9E36|nr:SDR family NAD(P)-dependent oxidoreductase [Vitreimonas sp.]HYD88108.1 SDR family NAD(P)-dependent oxidoreductase [Vitreimonas sp.]